KPYPSSDLLTSHEYYECSQQQGFDSRVRIIPLRGHPTLWCAISHHPRHQALPLVLPQFPKGRRSACPLRPNSHRQHNAPVAPECRTSLSSDASTTRRPLGSFLAHRRGIRHHFKGHEKLQAKGGSGWDNQQQARTGLSQETYGVRSLPPFATGRAPLFLVVSGVSRGA
ncbi:MAG: hypothetical protein KC588_18630, partial [Nitrospira sp.]|nr:hypothetical protein [Nitrospira sp.]